MTSCWRDDFNSFYFRQSPSHWHHCTSATSAKSDWQDLGGFCGTWAGNTLRTTSWPRTTWKGHRGSAPFATNPSCIRRTWSPISLSSTTSFRVLSMTRFWWISKKPSKNSAERKRPKKFLRSRGSVWLDCAIFERSWGQIFLTKLPKIFSKLFGLFWIVVLFN